MNTHNTDNRYMPSYSIHVASICVDSEQILTFSCWKVNEMGGSYVNPWGIDATVSDKTFVFRMAHSSVLKTIQLMQFIYHSISYNSHMI